MLSIRDLRAAITVRDGVILPRYLGESDGAWLRALIDEYDAAVSRPRRLLDARLRETLRVATPDAQFAIARKILDRHYAPATAAAVSPLVARATVFGLAAAAGIDRNGALAMAAAELGVRPVDVEASLFADIGSERIVTAPSRPLILREVSLQANLALAQALLHRSATVRIDVAGQSRSLIRHAKWRGLIWSVAQKDAMAREVTIDVSGPFSLFKRTLIYGRALAGLVPHLFWCDRFRLRAECYLFGEKSQVFELRSGDPILPSPEPRRFDSRLEERFAREFARIAPAWNIVREPEPFRAGAGLIFPDFALEHRTDPSRRYLLEIMGYWTKGYVIRKLAQLRAAAIDNLILCLDAERDCSASDMPCGARVLFYRRHVDAEAVRKLIES